MNIEETLRESICWEDIDTFLIVGVTEDGKIEISDYQGCGVEADTFAEALQLFYETKGRTKK